jgi:hypothetical protein
MLWTRRRESPDRNHEPWWRRRESYPLGLISNAATSRAFGSKCSELPLLPPTVQFVGCPLSQYHGVLLSAAAPRAGVVCTLAEATKPTQLTLFGDTFSPQLRVHSERSNSTTPTQLRENPVGSWRQRAGSVGQCCAVASGAGPTATAGGTAQPQLGSADTRARWRSREGSCPRTSRCSAQDQRPQPTVTYVRAHGSCSVR